MQSTRSIKGKCRPGTVLKGGRCYEKASKAKIAKRNKRAKWLEDMQRPETKKRISKEMLWGKTDIRRRKFKIPSTMKPIK